MAEQLSSSAAPDHAPPVAAEMARAADLPDALAALDAIAAAAQGRRLALFLDFDGTLTPIVARPEDAWLPPATRLTLERIARLVPTAVVSGRDLDDVRARIGLDRLYYAGSHGFDFAGPDGWRAEHPEGARFLAALDAAAAALRARLAPIPGAQVERKRFAIAVHYRQAAEADAPRIAAAVGAVAAEQPALHMSGGKMVWELRPAIDWHKGRAILWLLARLGLDDAGTLPLFIGDDVTDEDAFRTLRGRGLCIVVDDGALPPRETHAHYRLADTEAVRHFLDRLAGRLAPT